ncbi:DUF5667 domain-containing protein [Streptomyces ovatisporus]|uniref:DUF5667 domain-containing protein n=1 Tax=Streptomyces ovatisporus TaxID=1128682 RepID=A0ABV9AC48_9ACTN
MIGSVATSRRATAFAGALDEHELEEATAAGRTAEDGGARVFQAVPEPPPATGGGGTGGGGADTSYGGGGDSEHTRLLEVADRLGELPRPALAPEVKTVQRAQLIAAMEAEFASPEARARQVPEQRDGRGKKGAHRAPAPGPMSKLRPRSRLTKGLAAGGLGVGVAASALGGVAAASSEALPGDSLYGLKRGMEDLRLDMADDEANRGLVHLDHASTRMQEARRLMERARGGAELDYESLADVRRALSGMRNEAADGHRLLSAAYARDGSIEPMRSLSSFRADHGASWSRMKDRLPPQLSDVRDEVSSVLDAMDDDIEPLAGLLADPAQDAPRTPRKDGADRTEKGGSPEPRSSAGSQDTREREDETSDAPAPSGSTPRSGELIGGGGLLDPDGDQHSDPSRPASGEGGRPLPGSEVTLPPILPEVLPDLRDLSTRDD